MTRRPPSSPVLRRLRWLLGFALLMYGVAHAAAPAPACPQQMLELAPWVEVLDDPSGTLAAQDVLHLPASRFHTASARSLMPGVSNATWWLRINLRNDTQATCERWLLVGPARMRNVQLFLDKNGHVTSMRHGPSYPLHEWALAQRRPTFPLQLDAGETAQLVVRVPGRYQQVAFTPQLWRPQALRDAMQPYELLDGAVFGAMLLLVLAAVALSRVFRRPSLLYMALGVLCYTCYFAVASNYGVLLLWPEQPGFDAWIRMLLICLTFFMAYNYLCDVVRIRRLEVYWHYFFVVARTAFLILGVTGSLLDPAITTGAILVLSYACRIALTLALLVGMWRGLVRSWFPPVLVTLLWVQMLLRYTHLLGDGSFYAPDSDMFSTTVLPGGILLLVVALLQIRKAQRRGQRAQLALDQQRESERTRLEHQVATRTDELQRALQARSTLLARISHDLRSPLVGIVDAARQWRDGQNRRDYPRLIEHSARQQMSLIDELLEFSRDEKVGLELMAAPGYLHSFLHDVAEQGQLLAERRDNRLERHFSADLPAVVCADFRRLRQVLMNLLGNAAKFTQNGRIAFVVNMESLDDEQVRLRLVVEDSGIGVAPNERERLLLPFTRGGNAANHEGSGLGLSIVTQLLQLMDTRLQIDDGELGGTRVSFTLGLPLAAEDELDPAFAGSGAAAVDGAGRCVLVVDDQRLNRELLCDLLDSHGFDSLAAADGGAALALLASHRVDLLLTDQYMDGMGGWALLQAVRRQQPALPVLLYSALPPSRPAEIEASLSFDASLLKPADSTQLLGLIARALGDTTSTTELSLTR